MDLTLNTQLGDIVTANLPAAALFERHGLDFCCQGHQTLAVACRDAGLDPAVLLDKLRALPPAATREENVAELPTVELLAHIVDTHHAFLRDKLPEAERHCRKILEVHGDRHPELEEVLALLLALQRDMYQHLEKEEKILFPYIRALAQAGDTGELPHACFATVRGPIAMMEQEHEAVGEILHRLREITQGFTPPPDGCATYMLAYRELAELEHDTHLHVAKENYVLHPRALKLEETLK